MTNLKRQQTKNENDKFKMVLPLEAFSFAYSMGFSVFKTILQQLTSSRFGSEENQNAFVHNNSSSHLVADAQRWRGDLSNHN